MQTQRFCDNRLSNITLFRLVKSHCFRGISGGMRFDLGVCFKSVKLTEVKCKNTKPSEKPIKLADGGGMYLHIMPTGGKKWRLKYRFLGKEKLLTLGSYPRMGLKEAREKRDIAKNLLDEGVDPSEKRKLDKMELAQDHDNSFENVAREWHEQNKHIWKPKHAENVLRRFETKIFPVINIC